jgi:serine/threonine protein kinase
MMHDYVEESWVCGMPFATSHIHYCMVLGVVGRELSTFRSTRERGGRCLGRLVFRFCASLHRYSFSHAAHEDAYHKAGILHRDVSVGNLIVTDDGEGLLIDWDLCRKRSTLQKRCHD